MFFYCFPVTFCSVLKIDFLRWQFENSISFLNFNGFFHQFQLVSFHLSKHFNFLIVSFILFDLTIFLLLLVVTGVVSDSIRNFNICSNIFE